MVGLWTKYLTYEKADYTIDFIRSIFSSTIQGAYATFSNSDEPLVGETYPMGRSVTNLKF